MKVQHALAGLPFLGILVGMFFANSVGRTSSACPSRCSATRGSAPVGGPHAEDEERRFSRDGAPARSRPGVQRA